MAARTKKAKNDKAPEGNGQAALIRELWQAAVNLRGSIEPADYKRYVLPIIFLRFLSLRYERRREELVRLIEDPTSDWLCRMNLFIHGIDGDIRLGNSYFDDKHATLKADYVLANPPFNDGSKGEDGWGATRIKDKDPRLTLENARLPLSPRNGNSMWILHFLYHLAEGGTAGFVMATGELSNGETARLEVRKTLLEQGYVDCIVQLAGQLFANTQIPCSLWFLSRNRGGQRGFRKRQNEVLFIDGRKLGVLIPGSRKQKQLSPDEIEKIAGVYRQFRREGVPTEVPGFCKVASLDEIRGHGYALTPGPYVGAADGPDDDEPFEEKLPRLAKQLEDQFAQSAELEKQIRANLSRLTKDVAGS